MVTKAPISNPRLRGLIDILPLVVDANVFLRDMKRTCDRGHPTALFEAASLGRVRVYAATSVRREVEGNLSQIADQFGIAQETFAATWDEYRSRTRFVDVPSGDVGIDDPRLDALAERDKTDLPTARLSLLVAPCLVLSTDKDLVDLGLARDAEWLRFVLAVRQLSIVYGTIPVGTMFTYATAAGTTELVKHATAALKRWPWLGLGLAGLLLITADRIPAAGSRLRQGFRTVAPIALEFLTTLMQTWDEAESGIRLGLVDPRDGIDELQAITHVLARAEQPLLATEIAGKLKELGVTLSPQRANAVLKAHPMYVHAQRHRWQLGYDGVLVRGAR